MSFSFTQGDDFTLKLTLKVDGVAVSIAGSTVTTHFKKTDNTELDIPSGDHTIVESGGSDTGRVNVDMTAAKTALMKAGVQMPFYTKVVDGSGDQRFYWGSVTNIRETF